MDISARAFSIMDRPRSDHLGHQCSHAPGRPNLHLVSSSRRPGWKLLIGLRHRLLLISRSSFVRAKGRSFVPARGPSLASRAGAIKAGRRAWLAAGTDVARPRLDSAEHGARITRVGRRLPRRSSSARRSVLWPAPPRRCGQACWRARSPARYGATASWRPRASILVIAWGIFGPVQGCCCRLKRSQQNMHAAIVGGDVMGDRFAIICAVIGMLGLTTGGTVSKAVASDVIDEWA